MSLHVIEITTPENLRLRFLGAGLATRAVALSIDILVIGSLLQVAWWAVSPFETLSPPLTSALWVIAAFLVQWGYGAVLEWRFGSTLGKRLLGIHVVDQRGLPVGLPQAMLRNLLRIVDLLPLLHLAGAVGAVLDRDGRRLGDLAAQTLVVRQRLPQGAESAFDVTPRAPGQPAELLRLAKKLSPLERGLLTALHNRRARLTVQQRVQFGEAFALHLSARHGFERDLHMSGERFLLRLEHALAEQGSAQES